MIDSCQTLVTQSVDVTQLYLLLAVMAAFLLGCLFMFWTEKKQ